MDMLGMVRNVFLFFLVGLCTIAASAEAEAKPLYLCDNGETVLLTDKASLGCPLYRPQAELIVVPDGATWSDVEWAVATKHAESIPPATRRSANMTQDVCGEWGDLNLRTDGGLDMGTAESTRRWLALSRIVTETNLCEEYIGKEVYPHF